MRVRLQDLRFPKPVTGGCNYMLIGLLAYEMRASNWEPDPIEVTAEPGGWRISDGRHRAIAAMVAGRRSLRAVEVTRAGDSPSRRRRGG